MNHPDELALLLSRHHQDLFEEVIRGGGAIVSPYWPTVAPRSFRFRERNSVIALLARAVVVVRARSNSGSLSTARFAKRFGRPVLAIPANVGDGYGVGCNELLANGATPLTEPNQLAKALGVQTNLIKNWPNHERGSPEPWPESPLSEPVSLSAEEEVILGALKSDTILDLDTLHVRSGLSVARLSACVLNLEMKGLIHRTESDEFFVQ